MRRFCLATAALLTIGVFTGCSSSKHQAHVRHSPQPVSHVNISAGDSIGATLYTTNQRRSVASVPNN